MCCYSLGKLAGQRTSSRLAERMYRATAIPGLRCCLLSRYAGRYQLVEAAAPPKTSPVFVIETRGGNER